MFHLSALNQYIRDMADAPHSLDEIMEDIAQSPELRNYVAARMELERDEYARYQTNIERNV